MTDEQRIRKLASKMDQEDLSVLGSLFQKVAMDSAKAGAVAATTQEEQLHKLASGLVAKGYTDVEISGAVEKIAHHQKVAAECDSISQDCLAMGTLVGKQASAVQMQHADEIATYIGKKAAAVCVSELQEHVKQAEESEKEEDKKEDKEDKSDALPPFMAKDESEKEEDKKEDESEKEASIDRNVALLKTILEGTGFENAI